MRASTKTSLLSTGLAAAGAAVGLPMLAPALSAVGTGIGNAIWSDVPTRTMRAVHPELSPLANMSTQGIPRPTYQSFYQDKPTTGFDNLMSIAGPIAGAVLPSLMGGAPNQKPVKGRLGLAIPNNAPSHEQGGVDIEVEGGEEIYNKRSILNILSGTTLEDIGRRFLNEREKIHQNTFRQGIKAEKGVAVPHDLFANIKDPLWERWTGLKNRFDGSYELGAKGSGNYSGGRMTNPRSIDCSAAVILANEGLKDLDIINTGAANLRDRFDSVSNPNELRHGDLIYIEGVGEPNHIAQVLAHPETNELYIAESSGTPRADGGTGVRISRFEERVSQWDERALNLEFGRINEFTDYWESNFVPSPRIPENPWALNTGQPAPNEVRAEVAAPRVTVSDLGDAVRQPSELINPNINIGDATALNQQPTEISQNMRPHSRFTNVADLAGRPPRNFNRPDSLLSHGAPASAVRAQPPIPPTIPPTVPPAVQTNDRTPTAFVRAPQPTERPRVTSFGEQHGGPPAAQPPASPPIVFHKTPSQARHQAQAQPAPTGGTVSQASPRPAAQPAQQAPVQEPVPPEVASILDSEINYKLLNPLQPRVKTIAPTLSQPNVGVTGSGAGTVPATAGSGDVGSTKSFMDYAEAANKQANQHNVMSNLFRGGVSLASLLSPSPPLSQNFVHKPFQAPNIRSMGNVLREDLNQNLSTGISLLNTLPHEERVAGVSNLMGHRMQGLRDISKHEIDVANQREQAVSDVANANIEQERAIMAANYQKNLGENQMEHQRRATAMQGLDSAFTNYANVKTQNDMNNASFQMVKEMLASGKLTDLEAYTLLMRQYYPGMFD